MSSDSETREVIKTLNVNAARLNKTFQKLFAKKSGDNLLNF
jgi:hypothetical protein